MSWHAPSTDVTHAMYLPDKRAARIEPPLIPDRSGTQAEKEAWMRAKQAKGTMPRRSSRIERAIGSVCARYGVTRAQLLGKSRSHNIVAARGQACRELRDLDLSSTEVAHILNLSEHTSVLYHWGKSEGASQAATVQRSQAATDSPAITYCEGGISL